MTKMTPAVLRSRAALARTTKKLTQHLESTLGGELQKTLLDELDQLVNSSTNSAIDEILQEYVGSERERQKDTEAKLNNSAITLVIY